MRSPVQDANAGAETDVAPSKKHAVRTATVARQHGNQAQQRAKQLNQAASGIGQALGDFMEGKRATELEQRYTKAFHEQGMKTGMSEYQKDLKRSGFTEFIYGGQSPEYQGALNAAARNASNAMYMEEAAFIEGEGADLTPEEYQQHIQQKLTDYNLENFSDAPDAATAFMKNWKDNSNELSRSQVKNYQVRQQEKARATVAEGWQTDLDVYKTLVDQNPDKAVEHGQAMFSGKYKPAGMSDTAYREVLISEALTAARAHDYSAIKLLNESGLVSTFDDKELKEYEAVRQVIDTDNFDMLESGRLSYEAVIEDPYSTSAQVQAAQAQYDSNIIAVAARNTGTAKHIKTIAGADRWRGTLANQYRKRLEDEQKGREAEATARVVNNEAQFEADLFYADAEDRTGLVADRLDDLYVAMRDPSLNDGQRKSLREQSVKYNKMLEGWESAKKTKDDKVAADLAKKELEEANALKAGEAMLTRGAYVAESAKEKKAAVDYAVTSVLNTVLPDKDSGLTKTARLEQVLTNPILVQKFLKGAKNFEGELGESPVVQNAMNNLVAGLKIPNENNQYTEDQKSQAKALRTLQVKNPALFNSVFNTPERRSDVDTMTQAAELGSGIEETRRRISDDKRNADTKVAITIPAQEVMDKLQLSSAPPYIQNLAYTEYKANLHRGSDVAIMSAKNYMSGVHATADNTFVEYGSTFKPVGGKNLDDVMKLMKQTYRDDGGNTLSGWTVALQRLYKNDTTKAGQELYTLKQSPTLRVSMWDGQLMLTDGDRRTLVSNESIEVAISAYNQRQADNRLTKSRRGGFWGVAE